VFDSGGEASDGKFFLGLPPNATLAVVLELVECGFITPEDTPPLVHGPIAMFGGPCETVCHVSVGEEGLFSSNARVEADVMECLANGIRRYRRIGFLLPRSFDLAEVETTVLILCHEPLEWGLGFFVKDFGPAGALARAGAPSVFQSAQDVADSGLSAADFICDGLIGITWSRANMILARWVADNCFDIFLKKKILGGGVKGILDGDHCN
jgi:hypothetical protein